MAMAEFRRRASDRVPDVTDRFIKFYVLVVSLCLVFLIGWGYGGAA